MYIIVIRKWNNTLVKIKYSLQKCYNFVLKHIFKLICMVELLNNKFKILSFLQ